MQVVHSKSEGRTMSYASIMVNLEVDGASSEARLRLAAGVAKQHHATLIGVVGCMPRLPIAEAELGLNAIELESQRISSELAGLKQRFHKIAGEAQIPTDWRFALERPDVVVPREARAADLVIVGQDRTSADPTRSLDPGEAILKIGRPVLAVPASLSSLVPKRILIAWQDSRESRRAVRDALPFLRAADEILLTQVWDAAPPETAKETLGDVVRYLERHQIAASAGITLRSGGSVADELIQLAQRERVDIIVAGAYGHSRLGEWVFGGVTRELLTSSPVCCLFSH
jgi:nucleotide-binding universal stress UspA family protein